MQGMAGDVDLTAAWQPVAERISRRGHGRLGRPGRRGPARRRGGRASCAGTAGSPGRGPSRSPAQTYVRAGSAWSSTPAPSPPCRPIDGLDGTPYWTNREAIAATELPDSLVVLGGGASALELAQAFARFGVQVTVVEVADRILALEEPESSRAGSPRCSPREGIRVLTGVTVKEVAYDDGQFTVDLDGRTVTADRLLVGRRPPCQPRRPRPRAPSGSTRGPGPSRSTSGCGPATGSGRSATSPARARSRTCRCTRPPSRSATSSG